jgi:mTERF
VRVCCQVGVPEDSLGKVICRQPQVLTYTEDFMQLRVDFLRRHGLSDEDIAKAVVAHPQVCLACTAPPGALALTSPSVCLSVCLPVLQFAWHATRAQGLSTSHDPARSLAFCALHQGAKTEDSIAGNAFWPGPCGAADRQTEGFLAATLAMVAVECAVPSHLARLLLLSPQVLQYRIESMQEKVGYLRSIGMTAEQVPNCLVRLPQLLSLDIRNNLVPKYNYLHDHMGGDVGTVSTFPAYFSLSLPMR